MQALNTIKKYKEEGGSEDEVRRLYYNLSVKLIKDARIDLEEVGPHQELGIVEEARAHNALPPADSVIFKIVVASDFTFFQRAMETAVPMENRLGDFPQSL